MGGFDHAIWHQGLGHTRRLFTIYPMWQKMQT
jgi:hypothetical protein